MTQSAPPQTLRTYSGTRLPNGDTDVRVQRASGIGSTVFWDRLPLEPSPKVFDHSPTGFEWGYLGSGPAQLALALLLDVTGDKAYSVENHQPFKEAFVLWFKSEWSLTEAEIAAWVAAHPVAPARPF